MTGQPLTLSCAVSFATPVLGIISETLWRIAEYEDNADAVYGCAHTVDLLRESLSAAFDCTDINAFSSLKNPDESGKEVTP